MTLNRTTRKSKYINFERCKLYAQSLGVQTCSEWFNLIKPKNIPKNPQNVYKYKGWTNWYDFLGKATGIFRKKDFMPYEEAEAWVRKMGINTIRQFKKARSRPDNLPSQPSEIYREKGWKSWMHFLGKLDANGNPLPHQGYKKVFLSFEDAHKYVLERGIKTIKEYKRKRPNCIPIQPEKIYKDQGWISWAHYFGKKEEKRGRPPKKK